MNTNDVVRTSEGSGDYRVLRRLKPRDEFETVSPGQELKMGVLIDLETTGLDTTLDEVIELGLVEFAYLPDDRVAHVVDKRLVRSMNQRGQFRRKLQSSQA